MALLSIPASPSIADALPAAPALEPVEVARRVGARTKKCAVSDIFLL